MKTLYVLYSLLILCLLPIVSKTSMSQKAKSPEIAIDCCNNKPQIPSSVKAVNWADSLAKVKKRVNRKMDISERLLKKVNP